MSAFPLTITVEADGTTTVVPFVPAPTPEPEQEPTPEPTGGGVGAFQTVYNLVGPNPTGAIMQPSTGGDWLWPGDALSASSAGFFFDVAEFRPVAFARWAIVWTPGAAANGIRLLHADPGPTNIVVMGEQTGNPASTPVSTAVDITDQLNTLIQGRKLKFLQHQVRSNGSMTVHASRLEIVWA